MFAVHPAQAQVPIGQFGKNLVNWRDKEAKFYESYHFDVWHTFDLNDPVQKEHFRQVIDTLEGSYAWMSGQNIFNHNIKKRIPILLFNTHSEMESNPLVGGFMPEGIGAFVESDRTRMVIKADFSKPLGQAVIVHELVHEFQFDMMNKGGLANRLTGQLQVPNGYIEGFAEYVASLYAPHTRDDIRRLSERISASNPKSLPTWYSLRSDAVNGYTMWKMVFEFIEEKYDRRSALDFGTRGLQNPRLGELIYDLSRGALGNPDANSEPFDQQARDYWANRFELDRIKRPKPYQETPNFKGRSLTPPSHPYPLMSPALSPDGDSIAAFTIQKNGVSLVRFQIPPEMSYISKGVRDSAAKDKSKPAPKNRKAIRNLTPQLPPYPWEYLVVQGFETWPFNGSDVSWSATGDMLAFFARNGRDHTLFVIKAEDGKILHRIELGLDQAFSPSFGRDGKKIYFSAAKDVTRDLYVVNLDSGDQPGVQNLTNDSVFDTAPAVSPDGTKLVYVSFDGDYQHLFMLDLTTGKKEQLTFGRFNDNSPSWSDDGEIIVYTSDEQDQIWNLYTMDLASRTVSQWTNFFGEVATPIFARGSSSTVYYAVFRDDDQYRDQIYPNYEIFEAQLLAPIRRTTSANYNESTKFSFNSRKDLFRFELDSNQLFNPTKPPNRWKLSTGQVNFGGSAWGAYGYGYAAWSNMLETKTYFFQFISSGGALRVYDMAYLNQEKRLNYSVRGYNYKLPIYYMFYNPTEGAPRQWVLRNTLMNESGVQFDLSYPRNKFSRLEVFSRLRYRNNQVFGLNEEIINLFADQLTPGDIGLYRLLTGANGTSLSFGGAYVRDTVLFSQNTQGPFHGSAFRAQAEFAPPAGKFLKGFSSALFDGRIYRHIGSSMLLAGRATLSASSRASGDFILMGGSNMLRGQVYGSLVGNQIAYASGEFRFPLVNAIVLPGNMAIGPLRGLIFADVGIAKFTGEKLPTQRAKSYGMGIQFLPFSIFWSRDNGSWKKSFYLTYNW
ncbi:MAG: hypothetical protein A3B99_04995 [Candidatus Yanofskybacteria bacterium RIFCSPHIGHO2_02_FULL_44_12b]|nr:MAG: hypothetical protein A3B99_04995 [Candidatus Yanofskybacteria bacterium RIFCSPHIGHO2_02_FULL_44_12b]